MEKANIEDFWINCLKLEKTNKCVFFVIKLLCLPSSNACVERIFSALKLNKTDIRNKLEIDTVEAILLIKEYLKANDCKAFNMPISDFMVHNFGILSNQ